MTPTIKLVVSNITGSKYAVEMLPNGTTEIVDHFPYLEIIDLAVEKRSNNLAPCRNDKPHSIDIYLFEKIASL